MISYAQNLVILIAVLSASQSREGTNVNRFFNRKNGFSKNRYDNIAMLTEAIKATTKPTLFLHSYKPIALLKAANSFLNVL